MIISALPLSIFFVIPIKDLSLIIQLSQVMKFLNVKLISNHTQGNKVSKFVLGFDLWPSLTLSPIVY